MFSEKLDYRFRSAAEDKGVSTSRLAQILKAEGFRVSRKYLSLMSRDGIIKPADVISEGVSSSGRRVVFSKESLMDSVMLLLSIEASRLKGKSSKRKLSYVKYAKDTLQDVLSKDRDVITTARITSMTSACYFINRDSPLKDRLKDTKVISKELFRMLIAMWFSSRWVLGSKDHAIENDWNEVRGILFSTTTLKTFSNNLRLEINSNVDAARQENLSIVYKKAVNNKEAKASLKMWLELLMVFNSNKKIVMDEAEAYMSRHYNLDLRFQALNSLSILNLYSAIK